MALATSIRIEFVQEMPLSLNHYIDDQVPTLIVLDDRMFRVTSSKAVAELFTDGSSHRNLSVVVITQNLFPGGKYMWRAKEKTVTLWF